MLVGCAGASDGVGLVITLVVHILAELFVVDLMAVDTLGLFACLFHQLDLCHTVLLDLGVSHFECLEKFCFRHFVHLTLHHHNIVVCSTDHQFDVSLFDLLEGGVDHPFPSYACHSHLGDRTVEGYVTTCQGG